MSAWDSPLTESRAGATPPVQKPWFDRNWKWFVPALVGVGLLVLAAFVFAVMFFVGSLFRSSYPYKVAIDRANASAEVAERIGKPLKVGWFMAGSINYTGSEGDAAFNIPVSGPKGRGTIVVAAKRHAKQWTFETLEVDIDGQDRVIPLLEASPPKVRGSPSDST